MITPFGRYSSVLILATATIAAYSLTGAAIRHVSESYGTHPFQIAFFRTLLTIVPLLLLLRLQSTPLLPRRNRVAYLVRGGFETGATMMWVLAVSLMPLATYSAINFTSVLFALLAAAIFLREPVGIHRIVSILVGFVGALIVLTPGEDAISWLGGLAAVSNAACAGMSRALTRHVGRDASPNTIVFTTLLVGVIPISVAAAMTWQMPVATECLWYVAIAAGGFSAQFCLAASYRVGQVGEIASLEFIVIPMSAAVGFLAFGQIPSFRTWAGIAVIAVAAGYAIHRDRLASLPHRSPDLALRKDV